VNKYRRSGRQSSAATNHANCVSNGLLVKDNAFANGVHVYDVNYSEHY